MRRQGREKGARFRRELKGYSVMQVEDYISGLKAEKESEICDLKARLEEQKRENLKLKTAFRELKSRENNVTEALTMMIDKILLFEQTEKLRYSLESDRIALFRSKWESIVESSLPRSVLRAKRGLISGLLYKEEREFVELMQASFPFLPEFDEKKSEAEEQYLEESKRLLDMVKIG